MNGTEKQVKWATSIKESLVSAIKERIERMNDPELAKQWVENEDGIALFKEVAEKALSVVESVEDAKPFIDYHVNIEKFEAKRYDFNGVYFHGFLEQIVNASVYEKSAPALKGSKKQVPWATEIRHYALMFAEPSVVEWLRRENKSWAIIDWYVA